MNLEDHSCRSCRQLIDTLSQQVKELEQRQKALKKLNRSLADNLQIPVKNCSQTDWKAKYWLEVQKSCRLEKELMEIKISAEIDRKSMQHKRQNINKLNELIISSKLNGLQHFHEQKYRKGARKTIVRNIGNNIDKNELMMKIIR